MAELRHQAGQEDLFIYLCVHPSKDTEDLIDRVWKVAAAPDKINQVQLPRVTVLQNATHANCVDGCNGTWLRFAHEIVDRNPLVDPHELKLSIRNNIDLGRSNGSTLFLIGPAECGKIFLLIPLETLYKTFSYPSSERYSWVGIEEMEMISLNDFRLSKEVIPWEDLLRLLVGVRVWFDRPKNLYAQNMCIDSDNTIPVIGTCRSKYQWMGSYSIIVHQRETMT